MKHYGGRKATCISRRTRLPKKAYATARGAWNAVRASEATALVPEGALVPYPCPVHGFHIGGAPRHRRGNRVRRGA